MPGGMEDEPEGMSAGRGSDAEQVRQLGERLLAGDGLGRSHTLERLFRFLIACTLEGR